MFNLKKSIFGKSCVHAFTLAIKRTPDVALRREHDREHGEHREHGAIKLFVKASLNAFTPAKSVNTEPCNALKKLV
jgi:hypothetical protein